MLFVKESTFFCNKYIWNGLFLKSLAPPLIFTHQREVHANGEENGGRGDATRLEKSECGCRNFRQVHISRCIEGSAELAMHYSKVHCSRASGFLVSTGRRNTNHVYGVQDFWSRTHSLKRAPDLLRIIMFLCMPAER